MSKFFDDLKQGLEDVTAYQKGKLPLRSEFIEIAEPPMEHTIKDTNHLE